MVRTPRDTFAHGVADQVGNFFLIFLLFIIIVVLRTTLISMFFILYFQIESDESKIFSSVLRHVFFNFKREKKLATDFSIVMIFHSLLRLI